MSDKGGTHLDYLSDIPIASGAVSNYEGMSALVGQDTPKTYEYFTELAANNWVLPVK